MKVNSDVRIWYCSFKWLVWAWCLQWWLLQQKGSVFGVFPTGQYFKTFYFQESSLLLLLKQFFFFFFWFWSNISILTSLHSTLFNFFLLLHDKDVSIWWIQGSLKDLWRTAYNLLSGWEPQGKEQRGCWYGLKDSTGFSWLWKWRINVINFTAYMSCK